MFLTPDDTASLFQSPNSCTQVRDTIHKTIAELTSWSLKIAAEGIGPDTGAWGEAFKPGTSHFKKRGAILAKGFRRLFFVEQTF